MNIHGVTICIRYADYLRAIISNKKHFSSWTIITVAEDRETQLLAANEGLTLHISQTLSSRGEEFSAVNGKGKVINEVITQLPREDWVALIDSDTLLPIEFGQRLRALPLYNRALYGLAGRRIVECGKQASSLMALEPWEQEMRKYTSILGYFNLFSLTQANNRYPEQSIGTTSAQDAVKHDDYLFQRLFKPGNCRTLPFNALHVGPQIVNWSGRTSKHFELTPTVTQNSRFAPIAESCNSERPLCVLGCFGAEFDLCKEIGYVGPFVGIDSFGIAVRSTNTLEDADRTWNLKQLQIQYGSQLRVLLSCGSESLLFRNLNKCGVLYIRHEWIHEDWIAFIANMLPHLPPDCQIVTRYASFRHFPNSTLAMGNLLGEPCVKVHSGQSIYSVANINRHIRKAKEQPAIESQYSTIICIGNLMSPLQCILAAFTIQELLKCVIVVADTSRGDSLLRIACARFGWRYTTPLMLRDNIHPKVDFLAQLRESPQGKVLVASDYSYVQEAWIQQLVQETPHGTHEFVFLLSKSKNPTPPTFDYLPPEMADAATGQYQVLAPNWGLFVWETNGTFLEKWLHWAGKASLRGSPIPVTEGFVVAASGLVTAPLEITPHPKLQLALDQEQIFLKYLDRMRVNVMQFAKWQIIGWVDTKTVNSFYENWRCFDVQTGAPPPIVLVGSLALDDYEELQTAFPFARFVFVGLPDNVFSAREAICVFFMKQLAQLLVTHLCLWVPPFWRPLPGASLPNCDLGPSHSEDWSIVEASERVKLSKSGLCVAGAGGLVPFHKVMLTRVCENAVVSQKQGVDQFKFFLNYAKVAFKRVGHWDALDHGWRWFRSSNDRVNAIQRPATTSDTRRTASELGTTVKAQCR